jgi:hypothetical protein
MESEIFDVISKSDVAELKAKLTAYNGKIDFYDENGKFTSKLGKTRKKWKT